MSKSDNWDSMFKKKREGAPGLLDSVNKNTKKDKSLLAGRDPLLEKAAAAIGEETFVPAVEAYREKHGVLPDDFHVLAEVLEKHPDGVAQIEALTLMDAAYDAQVDATQRAFKSRVTLLRLTGKVAELKKLAGRIARARGW